jgi:hypothetical protein
MLETLRALNTNLFFKAIGGHYNVESVGYNVKGHQEIHGDIAN